MSAQATEKWDTETLRKEAGQLLNEHRRKIRAQAEAMLSKSATDLGRMSDEDVEKLMFEFQAYQIELELQNEELKSTYQALSASRDDFARLYNLSPVAYLTLNEQGIIQKANIAAEQLLGISIKALVNNKLAKFIHPSDQGYYHFFLHGLVMEKNNQILNAKLATTHSNSTHSNAKDSAFTAARAQPALTTTHSLI